VHPATKTCSKCKARKFCSVECQRKDWKAHKKNCSTPQRRTQQGEQAEGESNCDDSESLEESWARMQKAVEKGKAHRMDVSYNIDRQGQYNATDLEAHSSKPKDTHTQQTLHTGSTSIEDVQPFSLDPDFDYDNCNLTPGENVEDVIKAYVSKQEQNK
jgi:hypothetical protein